MSIGHQMTTAVGIALLSINRCEGWESWNFVMYTPAFSNFCGATPAYKAHIYGTIVAVHRVMPDLAHLVFSFISVRLQIQIKHSFAARQRMGSAATGRFKIPTCRKLQFVYPMNTLWQDPLIHDLRKLISISCAQTDTSVPSSRDTNRNGNFQNYQKMLGC